MELYLDLISPPCRSVFLFAKVLQIPFDFKLVKLSAGQQYTEEFGRISSIRKVPVMKEGSFILTESVAILKFLAQKHASSAGDHWYPADLQQQARVNEYLSWQHLNLRIHGSRVFLLRTLYPLIMGSEVPEDKMDAAVENLTQSVNLLEEKFLQDKAFIVGDKVSLADLVAVIELMQPIGTGLNVLEGHPRLIAWRERVKQEVGKKLFDEAHESVMKVNSLPQEMQRSSHLQALIPKFQKVFNW
ncbi:glutathione S-transferase theta-3-like [Solea senegalensis]|uniref:glutathione transferase n=1 Tax=Solea senegalensis TaxID=28829 RepID=A0AAV6QIE5_SOLSE|nr:glutathione S-transferase theta-3-like [Solea senegalensis]KAG7490757.1 glutathione S-transferase theta-3-like [Solea senegalensis]